MEIKDTTLSIKDRVKQIKGFGNADVPDWDKLVLEFDKTQHDVHRGTKFSEIPEKNKIIVDYGGQRLITERMVQMINTIPVERVYEVNNDVDKTVKEIIEAVYADVKIDTENNRRLMAYFGACEVASLWTGVEQQHDRYGVPCNTRLKLISHSPMGRHYSRLREADLYPQFDEWGDMLGFGIGGETDEGEEWIRFYTNDTIEYIYKEKGKDWEYEVTENPIGKIPISYMFRPEPIYEGQTSNIDAIEVIESSQGQIVKRNSAPVMQIQTDDPSTLDLTEQEARENERKIGVSRELWVTSANGGVSFVESPINAEAPDLFVNRVKNLIEAETGLPLDLSINALRSIGQLSGELLKQILLPAHLKVGQEQGEIIEFLDRELRVVKELLATAIPKYADAIRNIKVENVITPFVMNNETEELEKAGMRIAMGVSSRENEMRGLGFDNVDVIKREIEKEEIEISARSSAIGSNPYEL